MSAPVYNPFPTVKNRPMARTDAQGRVIPSTFGDLAFQGEYTGSNLIYAGFARPGTATSAASWKIMKMAYSGSNLVSITWPEDTNGAASSDYQFVWDNRASYTYA